VLQEPQNCQQTQTERSSKKLFLLTKELGKGYLKTRNYFWQCHPNYGQKPIGKPYNLSLLVSEESNRELILITLPGRGRWWLNSPSGWSLHSELSLHFHLIVTRINKIVQGKASYY
jgi:hypothetical protein